MESKIAPELPHDGWLRFVRRSTGISQREAAARAGVSQQAFDQYEKGELRASITLECLQRAAAALDHEVVYFLRPSATPSAPKRRAVVDPEADYPVNLL